MYDSLLSNSAIQIHYLAKHLTKLNSNCVLAVPKPPYDITWTSDQGYKVIDFRDVFLSKGTVFNGESSDIVHAWTPREIVRKFSERLREDQRFNLVVHLEDNEDVIVHRILNKPFEKLIRTHVLGIPNNLSHPRRSREFISSAEGATVIVDPLSEFVPDGVPWMKLWPGVDHEYFSPDTNGEAARVRYGLAPSDLVLVYTGNVHGANAAEVSSVYEAIKLLRQEGIPAKLLRTGVDSVSFLGRALNDAQDHVVELGYIGYAQMPDVLACGDLLIQPGKPDEFNNYRFPSKLPEYLAMGKPVILPKANVGLHLKDMEEAIIRENVDARAIADAAKLISSDDALRDRLGQGARALAVRELNWRDRAIELLSFYTSILAK